MVTIPYAFHGPMKGVREEVFFKHCRMHGISFDRVNNSGTYFHLIDSVIGGAVSMMTIASSRRRSLHLAIAALSFIIQQFGREHPDLTNSWGQVTSILASLKSILKAES
jgi:lipoprotein signal peptidase